LGSYALALVPVVALVYNVSSTKEFTI
jgi:hypothetical protein